MASQDTTAVSTGVVNPAFTDEVEQHPEKDPRGSRDEASSSAEKPKTAETSMENADDALGVTDAGSSSVNIISRSNSNSKNNNSESLPEEKPGYSKVAVVETPEVVFGETPKVVSGSVGRRRKMAMAVHHPGQVHFDRDQVHSDHDPVHRNHDPVHRNHDPIHLDHDPVHFDHDPVHLDHDPVQLDHDPVQSDYDPVHFDHDPVHYYQTFQEEVLHHSLQHDHGYVSVSSAARAEPLTTQCHGSNVKAHVGKGVKDDSVIDSGYDYPVMSTETQEQEAYSDPALYELPDTRRKSFTGDEPKPYRGMPKEDLLRHSGKPFWRRLRYVCMSIVLLGWLALIITVVALVLVYPKCRTPPEQDWWRRAVVYRVYVRSFQDNNGDGIGDLEGVRSRLDYLQSIGVNTISLCPVYPIDPASNSDTQITNHKDIDASYGTLAEFDQLVNASHTRGMYVVMDFIPNHTGVQHPWFLESRNSSRHSNPKRNYYVWENGASINNLLPPNNWRSVYNEDAWFTAGVPRGQFYLHQFDRNQPDLNLRSSEVKDQLQDILEFWLDRGVDGFYIRHSAFLLEDYDTRNESLIFNSTNETLYSSYNHVFTYGRQENHDMFARWRAFLDDYGNDTGQAKLLFADRTGEIGDIMTYYGHFNRDGVNFPLNVFCLDLNASSTGVDVARLVRQWMAAKPEMLWANWLGGTDTSPRLIDRLGEKLIRPFMALIMLLPGTPVLYYGDEIGMRSTPSALPEIDLGQRNLSMRSPMMWDNSSTAGFCTCTSGQPWMPISPDYGRVNVKRQMQDDSSLLQLFRNLTDLRTSQKSFHYGDYNEGLVDDEVFSFVRDFDGEKGFLVALNFVNRTVTKNFGGTYDTIPAQATVHLRTGSDVAYGKDEQVSTSGLQLGPYQGVILSWDFVAKEL